MDGGKYKTKYSPLLIHGLVLATKAKLDSVLYPASGPAEVNTPDMAYKKAPLK